MLQTKYLILLLCLSGNLSNPANDDTVNFTKIGENYYIIFSAVTMNWFAAVNLCQTFNSDLVTIDSETELNDLHAYLKANNLINRNYWISGNDLAEEGKYMSLSTGRPMIYMKFWPAGPPESNKEKNCLNLGVGREIYMYVYPCSAEYNAICEKRIVFETYTTGSCENISTDCALKTLGRAYLRMENTFNCRE